MSIANDSHQAFHRDTALIFALLTPEQTRRLAESEEDAGLADRLSELADKANECELSPAERAEYEAYIEADNLLAVLRAEARFHLAGRSCAVSSS
jgi:hypothetical protein